MTLIVNAHNSERSTFSFELTRDAIHNVLAHCLEHKWSLQGFGMLRTYLSKDRSLRLHVWSKDHVAPGVSLIHDHPWHLKSLVIGGRIVNRRYQAAYSIYPHHTGFDQYMEQRILCGPGGCLKEEPKEVFLRPLPGETYEAGGTYHQFSEEIHESGFEDGTVSLVKRTFLGDTEHARVFWRRGEEWGSAEPRDATPDEVSAICAKALAVLDKEGNSR